MTLDTGQNLRYNGIDVVSEFNSRKRLEGSLEETLEICLEIAKAHDLRNYNGLVDFIYVNRTDL